MGPNATIARQDVEEEQPGNEPGHRTFSCAAPTVAQGREPRPPASRIPVTRPAARGPSSAARLRPSSARGPPASPGPSESPRPRSALRRSALSLEVARPATDPLGELGRDAPGEMLEPAHPPIPGGEDRRRQALRVAVDVPRQGSDVVGGGDRGARRGALAGGPRTRRTTPGSTARRRSGRSAGAGGGRSTSSSRDASIVAPSPNPRPRARTRAAPGPRSCRRAGQRRARRRGAPSGPDRRPRPRPGRPAPAERLGVGEPGEVLGRPGQVDPPADPQGRGPPRPQGPRRDAPFDPESSPCPATTIGTPPSAATRGARPSSASSAPTRSAVNDGSVGGAGSFGYGHGSDSTAGQVAGRRRPSTQRVGRVRPGASQRTSVGPRRYDRCASPPGTRPIVDARARRGPVDDARDELLGGRERVLRTLRARPRSPRFGRGERVQLLPGLLELVLRELLEPGRPGLRAAVRWSWPSGGRCPPAAPADGGGRRAGDRGHAASAEHRHHVGRSAPRRPTAGSLVASGAGHAPIAARRSPLRRVGLRAAASAPPLESRSSAAVLLAALVGARVVTVSGGPVSAQGPYVTDGPIVGDPASPDGGSLLGPDGPAGRKRRAGDIQRSPGDGSRAGTGYARPAGDGGLRWRRWWWRRWRHGRRRRRRRDARHDADTRTDGHGRPDRHPGPTATPDPRRPTRRRQRPTPATPDPTPDPLTRRPTRRHTHADPT